MSRGTALILGVLITSLVVPCPAAEPAATSPGKVSWRSELLSPEAVAEKTAGDVLLDEYEAKRTATADTAPAQIRLAAWCGSRKLVEQQRAHLTRVLELEPQHAEARKQLGYRRIDGQWFSREELRRSEERARSATAAFKRYEKQLRAIAVGLSSPKEKAQQVAREQLLKIQDPAAIPIMEAVLNDGNDKTGLALVEALAAMTAPEAAVSLSRIAAETPARDVRDAAVKRLKERAYDYYVPTLLATLTTPPESKVDIYQAPDGRLTYRHWFYCEGEDARRMIVFDQAFRRPNGGQVNDGAALAQRQSSVALAATQESIRIEDNNERICKLLNRVTGLDMPAKAEVWWSWWNELTETGLADEKPLYQQYVSQEEVLKDARQFYGSTAGGNFRVSTSRDDRYECLIAGTPVWTLRGPRAVESIQPGDLVLSQNVETGECAYKPVLRTTSRPPAPLVAMQLENETIVASGGHLFWREGEAWRRARQMDPSSSLVTFDGTVEFRESTPAEQEPTYNLIVADFHTYFVGQSKLLSHDNTLPKPTSQSRPGEKAAKVADR